MGVMGRLNQARTFGIRTYGGVSTKSTSVTANGSLSNGVGFTGDKELDRLLATMHETLRDKYIKAANAAVIRYVVQPKVKAAISGSETIGKKKGVLSEKQRLKNYQPRRRKDWPTAWKLKLDAPHAHLLEFGTKNRQTKKAGKTPSSKMPSGWSWGTFRGQIKKDKFAFMRKALYGSEAEAKQAFIKAIKAFVAEQSTKAKFAKRAILGVKPRKSRKASSD